MKQEHNHLVKGIPNTKENREKVAELTVELYHQILDR